MNDLNYIYLGRLKSEVVSQFEAMIRSNATAEDYQWVYLSDAHREAFKSYFNNSDVIKTARTNQKAFFSKPDHGFRIHKDEPGTFCALNIVVSCNPGDWVRWYDESYINGIAKVENIESTRSGKPMRSRNVPITTYEYIPFAEEVTNQQPGDVYLVNTDRYHSFKCNGTNDRIILQTKFWTCPSIEELAEQVKDKIFSNYML